MTEVLEHDVGRGSITDDNARLEYKIKSFVIHATAMRNTWRIETSSDHFQ
ncbi:hypothetical protein PEC302107_39040 [Pectobacterium araliae]|nr:hypothetical protein PEC302107_39040 [Pectobacterium carotovorum subsp. carotovorum]